MSPSSLDARRQGSVEAISAENSRGLRALTDVQASITDELDAATPEAVTVPDGAPTHRLEEVFATHGAYVARALRCLGVREDEVPDAVQEVFLVVHRRLTEFEGRASLRTWLYAICLRQAMRQRRRRARRREEPVARPPEPDADVPTPREALERQRALVRALAILERLDEDKRAVFVLYEVEQLPMGEVAEVLGCPVKTAYSRLYAARREVRRMLPQRNRRPR